LEPSILRRRAEGLLGSELLTNRDEVSTKREVGFFDGKKMQTRITSPISDLSWTAWLGLVFKYRSSVWRAKEVPNDALRKFHVMLNSIGRETTFESVGEMIEAADLGVEIGLSGPQMLNDKSIGEKYIQEILGPQVRKPASRLRRV